MLNKFAREELERQHYRIVGEHSAVKICGWTKNMITGEGGCYKLKFYGIMSHQCMQMTTSISCANRCKFCWRGYKAPVAKEWKWGVDDPKFIFTESIKAHHKLLEGYKGNEKAKLYEGSNTIKHVALSLTGEPIIYPRMNEMIDEFNKKGISTFMVTNAQYPDAIKNLKPVTQLYISVDASNKELLKDIDVPLFDDYWKRLNQSLDALHAKKQRTTIRLTMVKGVNDIDPKGYADLIMKGFPDFIEIKAYMHIGASRQRLSRDNMPWHEEVVAFTQELMKYLPEYDIVTEHVPSRVVMCAKKTFFRNGQWMTWIDFPKYNTLVNASDDFATDDYLKKTPIVGLSGRNTKDESMERLRLKQERIAAEKNKGSGDDSEQNKAVEQEIETPQSTSDIIFAAEKKDEMDLE